MRTINHSSRFIAECYSRYPKQNLGEHISVIRGVSYKPADVRNASDDETVIILRSNNISDGEINYDDLVYVTRDRVQEVQRLQSGDIVMCGSNGSISLVGKAGLLKNASPNTSFGAFCLGIKCKSSILPEYLNTYFNTPIYRDEIESMGNGTNIINIRPDNITSLSIPIPPIEEQKAFVSIVRQSDKSKFNSFKSRFIEMFGCAGKEQFPVKKLGDMAECFAGATPSTSVNEYWENGTIPWMSSGEVHRVHVDKTEAKITQCGYDHASTKMVPIHSVVIALAGQGKTRGTVATTEIPLCTNQSLCAIVPGKEIHYEYLFHNLNGRYLELRGMAGDVNGRGGLNLKIIQNIPIAVPPMSIQEEFVKIAQQADKSKYLS